MKRLFSWRPRTFQEWLLVWIVVIVILVIFIIVGYWIPWTGFDGYKPDPNYEPEKKLWDWLELLIIPAVLASGAYYFNRAERRNELEIAQKERQNELQIAEQRTQDSLLQTYLDQMTELLLAEKLRKSAPDDEVRHVAQVRTLIALRRLDRDRRTILIQFLQASQLVGIDEAYMIVDFRGVDLTKADLRFTPFASISFSNADLERANLEGANLEGADLTGAYLVGADLTGAYLVEADFTGANLAATYLTGAYLVGANLQRANLEGANLQRADLTGANLEGANLEGANLTGADLAGVKLKDAKVTQQQFEGVASLKGIVMPDGSQPP